jgi:hypothetical protein
MPLATVRCMEIDGRLCCPSGARQVGLEVAVGEREEREEFDIALWRLGKIWHVPRKTVGIRHFNSRPRTHSQYHAWPLSTVHRLPKSDYACMHLFPCFSSLPIHAPTRPRYELSVRRN